MKRNIWFIILVSSLLFSAGCSDGGSCNGNTSVPGQNGQLYVVHDANGRQQPVPVMAQNGNVQVPCGGGATLAQ